MDSESISVGKAAIGNLIGGMGYFYGQSKIALSGIQSVSHFSVVLVFIEEYAILTKTCDYK